MDNEFDDLSLFELFRMDAEEQIGLLAENVLALGHGQASAATLQSLMRGAHSFKGAARIVGLDAAVRLTHAMEDRFVAAIDGRAIGDAEIENLLHAVDLLRELTAQDESSAEAWLSQNTPTIDTVIAGIATLQGGGNATEAALQIAPTSTSSAEPLPASSATAEAAPSQRGSEAATGADAPLTEASTPADSRGTGVGDSSLRITAQRFNRVLATASDTLVQAQQLTQLAAQVRAMADDLSLPQARRVADGQEGSAVQQAHAVAALQQLRELLDELDTATGAMERKAASLHREVLQTRMRPLTDILGPLRRLVHDVGLELGKPARLEVIGERSEVDRDILERLRAPLEHLLRNALDHGLELPEEREAAGKAATGEVRLRARHESGRFLITLADDGRGIDVDAVRETSIRRGLVKQDVAAELSPREVLEFLFLPGFSTRSTVTQISGRGFGLDVVQSMVHKAGGSVSIESTHGKGTRFELTLPVSHSILRVMLVECEDETYAVPVSRISRVAYADVRAQEDGRLVVAGKTAEVPVARLTDALGGGTPMQPGEMPVFFLLDEKNAEAELGLAVDRFLGDAVVAVHTLDARLARMPAVSAVTITEENVPLLILDSSEIVRAGVDAARRQHNQQQDPHAAATILVVDDSSTIRQMLRRTLVRAGYSVTVAQHGAEAWGLLQVSNYDLLVSDVDMPEMNGIELVEHVRANRRTEHMPVMLLSYKSREDDRQRGLHAGADAYITKGEFEAEAFVQRVVDLIGEPHLHTVCALPQEPPAC